MSKKNKAESIVREIRRKTRSLNIPSQFQIRGVPTLIFFKKGEKVDQLAGAIPEETLTQKLNQLAQ